MKTHPCATAITAAASLLVSLPIASSQRGVGGATGERRTAPIPLPSGKRVADQGTAPGSGLRSEAQPGRKLRASG